MIMKMLIVWMNQKMNPKMNQIVLLMYKNIF